MRKSRRSCPVSSTIARRSMPSSTVSRAISESLGALFGIVSVAVLALPSLLTTELLTLGYAATIGLDGIESKARAVYAGLTETVTSRDPSAAEILRKLDPEIPGDQLTYGRLDRTMKACANAVYRLNYQLLLS